MTHPFPPDDTVPPGRRTVIVDGVELARGSRVRLRPSQRADILDLALAGRTAEVDGVEEDFEGAVHVAVVLEGDPGRDFGSGQQIGHRFFFSPEELEPVAAPAGGGPAARPRILVAGIGNIFCADDGFGPEVIAALRRRPLPPGVHAADFGIRGMDLAYRLLEGWHTALLVDAAPHGKPPGTVSVIEPDVADLRSAPQAHGMDPVQVLSLAAHLAEEPLPRVLVVGCEPEIRMTGDELDVRVGLSPPVRQAVDTAVGVVESLVAELLTGAGPMARCGIRQGHRPAATGEEVSSR
ncbi:hypothetical protein ACZ90_36030 [Streptomyces albus subsp. albus]|nr:hypothetical protein ACZ90_36030 [Streptomyces albus subsp. albus]